MAVKFHLCLLLIILVGMGAHVAFADQQFCDHPYGTCYYVEDECPEDMPVDCSENFYCTEPTNKCCCYE
uniref:Small cysteine-rich protein 2 n=1 Tax=Orbicella faveolata TaxID=48498 RepID=SCR2G_ORBFA|nr:RecName: Full=Small cysteine-rich protein 2; Short=Mfav-SCRiP2; Short=SCRiP2; Flags: Precursor [Orbicella faveolata]ACO24831.1 small cysteine-rich protein 2 [Orbicella faveolata]